MNLKKNIGAILTVLGVAGLIYAAHFFIHSNDNSNYDIKAFAIYGILGLIFIFHQSLEYVSAKDEA